MPTSHRAVDLSEHLEGLHAALSAFTSHVARAGLDAPVPTTPDWDMRALVAHQGMVHGWAAATVRGPGVDPGPLRSEGLEAEDPALWLREGGLDLVEAIESAPDDLRALVFLNDAPAPRRFWARRQCHETTIHAVDALSASLGRFPVAADTWITREVALDGIDELLTGFVTRTKSRLRSERPLRFAVRPDDAARSWGVTVSDRPAVTERDGGGPADVVLEASAVALYLALWNRTDEVAAEGFGIWRDRARVTWS